MGNSSNGRSNSKSNFKGNAKKKQNSASKDKTKKTYDKPKNKAGFNRPFVKKESKEPMPTFSDEVRLNKYLSNAGICSRREADVLIASGIVSINGKVILELGYKVKPGDVVKYDGGTISTGKKRYVLLNKPKDFVTTGNDAWGRKSVMGLVMKACKERVYPIGKLDKETTGLLFFTNDSDMEKMLTHPKYKASKIYHVTTNKAVKVEDLEKIKAGVMLNDGLLKVSDAQYVDGKTSKEIGVEIHSNKESIVKRIFEHLGYDVVKLDRVQYANLTKKDLPRGKFRHLTDQEVAFLKMN